MDLIAMAQNRDRTVLNAVMNIHILQHERNILTS
jgi:hypothetical protein